MRNLAIANAFICFIVWFAFIIMTIVTGQVMGDIHAMGLILLPLLGIACAVASNIE